MSLNVLKVLNANKETLLARIQKLYQSSKKLSDSRTKEKNFEIRYETSTETKTLFYAVFDRINSINASLDENFEPHFQVIETVDDLLHSSGRKKR